MTSTTKGAPDRVPTFDLDSIETEELSKLVIKTGGQRAFCRKYGIARSTLQVRLHKLAREPFGHKPAPKAVVMGLPEGDIIARYIVTAAQDSTKLHDEFLDNLLFYREVNEEEGTCGFIAAGFTYNKKLFEDHSKKSKNNVPLFPQRIQEYLVSERIRLCEGVDFCGEMNTLPTAETPLSGFETYTRHRWGIFPHAKVQLRSVPTMKHSPAKLIMTTGAVTRPNYVQKRAGIKASFNHTIGAVIVEVNSEGTFFCRHIIAEEDGSFYDLDRRVQTNMVPRDPEEIKAEAKQRGCRIDQVKQFKNEPIFTAGHRVKAVNWGDLHVAQIDKAVASVCFGYEPTDEKDAKGRRVWLDTRDNPLGGTPMLDALQPEYQFFHDTFDNQRRNHHNLRDPHYMYALHCQGLDPVEDEVHESGLFIQATQRPWCKTVVVESNHDLALRRWLREGDYRTDPPNAEFFLTCQLAIYRAIKNGDGDFSIFEHLLRNHFPDVKCDGVQFLREDESFMVLGIEKGMHGHLGANGGKGSPHAYTKMGPKSTTGHTHSCEIRDGSYVAGTSSRLDMGYNKGLSSWSHSHVVTLPNGKRQIVTLQDGKWRL